MKRIFLLVLALIMALSLTACGGNNEKKEKTYKVSHAHIYPKSDPLYFSLEEYTLTVKGDSGELLWSDTCETEIDGVFCTEVYVSKLLGSVKEEDGGVVFTVTGGSYYVRLEGENAEEYREKMIAWHNELIAELDPSDSYSYEYQKQSYENSIKLYSGEEIEANDEDLEDFVNEPISFSLDGNSRITEIRIGEDGGYTFVYGEDGRLLKSVEGYLSDGTKYEAEYREDGTPFAFRYVDEDGETTELYCDEDGTVRPVTGES